MKLKINLHFHTSDEKYDFVNYTFYEGLKEAKNLKFDAIALTSHNQFINRRDYYEFAKKLDILLILGIELTIKGRHIVILNPRPDIKDVKTFKDLKLYKKNHPQIFILAPHPYFGFDSLGKQLEKNIDIFDAIEYCWFYSKYFNRNKKGKKIAEKHNLPFIATSDTHNLKVLDKSYAIIEAKEKTAAAVFEAIKENKFQNITSPRKFLSEMLLAEIIRRTKGLFKFFSSIWRAKHNPFPLTASKQPLKDQ